MTKPRIVVMAGGTGGHVFPALAVARHLQDKGWDIRWLGTKQGIESEIITKTDIPLHYISIKGLRRKGWLSWCLAPYYLMRSLMQAIRMLAQLKPTVVLGMGGFVTGPGGIAAWLLRYPLIIHEQNAVVGLSNRILSHFAVVSLEGFPGAFKPGIKAVNTGNPVRKELLSLPPPRVRFKNRTHPCKVLVLGGSRGATQLNAICPEALALLPLETRPEIWHQTGADHLEVTQNNYQRLALTARVEPFIQDMAEAYAWADLVVCRAGALTVSEIMAVGIGSVLIPYPYAVDDHQTKNGEYLSLNKAAKLVSPSRFTAKKLASSLSTLLADRDHLLKMAEIAYGLSKRSALTEVAKTCEEIANRAFRKS